jgi:hypothetical protein
MNQPNVKIEKELDLELHLNFLTQNQTGSHF